MRYTTTDGHVLTDETVACLIGASLPTPAACHKAIVLLHDALAAGVSLDTLWRLSGIAVWDGLQAAREALSVALGQPQRHVVSPATTDDRIIFADLDEDDITPAAPPPRPATPAAPITPAAAPRAQRDAQLPMFDF